LINDYVLPKTVEDALAALKQGNAKLIAGGTDLMLDLKSCKAAADTLVDINGIKELKGIKESDGNIIIGAGTTHQEVAESFLIQEKAVVLAKASGSVGSLQIRNTATVVGNIVNAQPAADAAVALVALGAEAEIVDKEGTIYQPVENLYAGLAKCKVDSSCQIITAVRFPALFSNQGSAYVRLAKRGALALPMLCVAVAASLKDGKIEWVRIVMAPVSTKPLRALEAEELLKDKEPSEEVILEASKKAAAMADPRDSKLRGSRAYRSSVLVNLVKRGITEAIKNARQ